AGEDPAYGRRGQPARRPDRRAGLRRRRDTVRRRHAVRPDSGVRPERRARRAAGLSWRRRHPVLQSRRRLRRRGERGGCPVSETLTREEALRRLLAGGAALTIPGLVPAVARAATQADPKLGKTLTISNWVLYIDVNEKTKKRPTIELFQKRYGVKVRYIEDINDNSTFFGKIQAELRRGQSIGRDIIVMTDNSPYPALLVKNKWVEKLDKSAIPNIKNLQAVLRHPSWDPNRDYSLPWQSGMTGIAYNVKKTKPIV